MGERDGLFACTEERELSIKSAVLTGIDYLSPRMLVERVGIGMKISEN